MREIKFRGKRTDNGEWAIGSLESAFNLKTFIWVPQAPLGYIVEVVPETVGQFTGLKDSNDREIYEGDVIEIGNTSPPYLETVTFRDGCFETSEDCENICHVLHMNKPVVVVGNDIDHNVTLYGVTLKGFA